MGGVIALLLLLVLGLLIGRLITTRVLGEQEPITVLGFSVVLAIGAIGWVANLLLRMARMEIALPLACVSLLLVYLGLRRVRFVTSVAPPRLTSHERAAA